MRGNEGYLSQDPYLFPSAKTLFLNPVHGFGELGYRHIFVGAATQPTTGRSTEGAPSPAPECLAGGG